MSALTCGFYPIRALVGPRGPNTCRLDFGMFLRTPHNIIRGRVNFCWREEYTRAQKFLYQVMFLTPLRFLQHSDECQTHLIIAQIEHSRYLCESTSSWKQEGAKQ